MSSRPSGPLVGRIAGADQQLGQAQPVVGLPVGVERAGVEQRLLALHRLDQAPLQLDRGRQVVEHLELHAGGPVDRERHLGLQRGVVEAQRARRRHAAFRTLALRQPRRQPGLQHEGLHVHRPQGVVGLRRPARGAAQQAGRALEVLVGALELAGVQLAEGELDEALGQLARRRARIGGADVERFAQQLGHVALAAEAALHDLGVVLEGLGQPQVALGERLAIEHDRLAKARVGRFHALEAEGDGGIEAEGHGEEQGIARRCRAAQADDVGRPAARLDEAARRQVHARQQLEGIDARRIGGGPGPGGVDLRLREGQRRRVALVQPQRERLATPEVLGVARRGEPGRGGRVRHATSGTRRTSSPGSAR